MKLFAVLFALLFSLPAHAQREDFYNEAREQRRQEQLRANAAITKLGLRHDSRVIDAWHETKKYAEHATGAFVTLPRWEDFRADANIAHGLGTIKRYAAALGETTEEYIVFENCLTGPVIWSADGILHLCLFYGAWSGEYEPPRESWLTKVRAWTGHANIQGE